MLVLTCSGCNIIADKPMKLLVGTARNITTMNADGTDVHDIVAGKIGDLDYDIARNMVFWIDMDTDKVGNMLVVMARRYRKDL